MLPDNELLARSRPHLDEIVLWIATAPSNPNSADLSSVGTRTRQLHHVGESSDQDLVKCGAKADFDDVIPLIVIDRRCGCFDVYGNVDVAGVNPSRPVSERISA